MLYNKAKWIFGIVCMLAFSSTTLANVNIVPRSPLMNSEVNFIPVTLMWNVVGNTNEITLTRVEVFNVDNNGQLVGNPVWATSIFNIWQNQVYVDYREWTACGQYVWKITLYKNSIQRTRGEYTESNKRYTRVHTSPAFRFKINCTIENTVNAESAGYFDFPSDATPLVFSQKWGADIKFHYFSPYENDQIKCKIYDWERNLIAEKTFALKKGSNYLNWDELFQEVNSNIEVSEVLFLEAVNGKDLKKTLKFRWENE